MSKNQLLAIIISSVLSLACGGALAAEGQPADSSGFYGGISLRSAGQDGDNASVGLRLDGASSIWNRFVSPMADDNANRTLAFGGYRFANDLAVEAAIATADRYALQPVLTTPRRGVGLALVPDAESGAKSWNVDVYTTWEFKKRMSLYGRLGYAQTDVAPTSFASFTSDVVRRNRDGVNYGLGLRYDMTPALGLRVEYARFARLPGEFTTGLLPENDQLQFGLQYRF
ncbi:MAG: outer membrane beta-barrel protein [Burkholderiales bacterium]